MAFRVGIRKSRSNKSSRQKSRSYETMMRTLLLQNQQIIIQQQNMMFMVMKQFTNNATTSNNQQQSTQSSQLNNLQQQQQSHHQQQHQDEMQQAMAAAAAAAAANTEQHLFSQHHHNHQHNNQQQQHGQAPTDNNNNNNGTPQTPCISSQSTGITSTSTTTTIAMHQHAAAVAAAASEQHSTGITQLEQHTPGGPQTDSVHRHLQQVATHLQDNMGCYMTPASSEQDPISESKPSDNEAADELTALLEGDGLLGNNLLYNPSTDIGPITPYKHHHHSDHHSHSSQHHTGGSHHHETPSYYSSGCESLTTPRVEQPRQAAPVSVSQNVVKNLSNSFKSPTKTKSNINVQILSNSATREMKNSKAKIIQSMNISEFLRQVHHDNGSNSTSSQGAAHGMAK